MHSFEEIRAYIAAKYPLRINDPYLICFDVALEHGKRHQGLYLAELNDEAGSTYLRVSTPIGPLTGMDARRCLRFNWEQRLGFLAVSDLDGSPYLHLCENRPYELLNAREIDRLVAELGPLGDKLEQAISQGDDAL
ncbi:MAG: hypothetical protein JSS42_14170 [Proteobacteria bacterium]|uniref:hypothetical protein n=1 Tax=Rudaea sp. TaxID=2136325 RepID=UPI00321F96ED|nr:hypothetical protein [Pseudomonadota bacterium]